MSDSTTKPASDADAVLVVALLDREARHLERRERENKLGDPRLSSMQRKTREAYRRVEARLREEFNLPDNPEKGTS